MPYPDSFGVGFHQGQLLFTATGEFEVVNGFPVDRENSAGRAVFRSHIADGGAIRERQTLQPWAKEFDKF